MSDTNKTIQRINADNVLKKVYNKEDASLSVNGYLAGKIGRKITLQEVSPTVEVWRMYEKVDEGTADISGTTLSNCSGSLLSDAVVGNHILTAYNDYDITIISVNTLTSTIEVSAAPVTQGVGVTVQEHELLLKYRIEYSSSTKETLVDAERIA